LFFQGLNHSLQTQSLEFIDCLCVEHSFGGVGF
jgi:hypothetical protein